MLSKEKEGIKEKESSLFGISDCKEELDGSSIHKRVGMNKTTPKRKNPWKRSIQATVVYPPINT